jgi:hypothetical protein
MGLWEKRREELSANCSSVGPGGYVAEGIRLR